jgi:hypothetical protein
MPRSFQDAGLTEDRVAEALTEHKGDLIQTHLALGVSLGMLNNFVRNIPRLRRLFAEMDKLRREFDPDEYEHLSADRFREEIDARTAAYQLEGLEVIHELATTPHDSAMMADVRLKAAKELRGSASAQSGSLVALMNDLNEAYHRTAGRVKELRVSANLQLTVESAGASESIPRIPSAP